MLSEFLQARSRIAFPFELICPHPLGPALLLMWAFRSPARITLWSGGKLWTTCSRVLRVSFADAVLHSEYGKYIHKTHSVMVFDVLSIEWFICSGFFPITAFYVGWPFNSSLAFLASPFGMTILQPTDTSENLLYII